MTGRAWTAIVLAAGRGPDDPLAKAFAVTHKCLIPVGGVPMLARVVGALRAHASISRIVVSTDRPETVGEALGDLRGVSIVASGASAPESVLSALQGMADEPPVLITTADHALLDGAMLDHFLAASEASGADLTVGLATAETILAAHPDTRRTFLSFGKDRVSGCNLYALMDRKGVAAIELWRRVDRDRKKPWKIVQAFGAGALARYLAGWISLDSAFALAARRLGIIARPILMPQAEAAIDVDKPQDKALVDCILRQRREAQSATAAGGGT